MITRYTILKDGKELFSDLSQCEYFDRMNDLAIEFYQTGSPEPSTLSTQLKEEPNG